MSLPERFFPSLCLALVFHVAGVDPLVAQDATDANEKSNVTADQADHFDAPLESDAEETTPPKQETVTADVVLQQHEGRLARVEASIGSFLPGTQVHCTLHVTNETDRFILFDNIENGCKCLSVEPKRGEIAPGKTLDISLVLRVAPRPHRVDSSTLMIFKRGRLSQFMILLQHSMRGIAGFEAHSVAIKIPTGAGQYDAQIPFYADPESVPELLELTAGSTLEGLDFVLDYPNRLIRFTVPESFVTNNRVYGNLTLRNLETDAGGEVLIDLSQEQSLEAMPSIVRFRRDPEDPELLTARVLVVNRLGDPSQRGKTSAQFVFQDRALHTDLIRDTGKAQNYSVHLRTQDDPANWGKDERVLRCHLHGSGQTRTLQIPFFVDTSLLSHQDSER